MPVCAFAPALYPFEPLRRNVAATVAITCQATMVNKTVGRLRNKPGGAPVAFTSSALTPESEAPMTRKLRRARDQAARTRRRTVKRVRHGTGHRDTENLAGPPERLWRIRERDLDRELLREQLTS